MMEEDKTVEETVETAAEANAESCAAPVTSAAEREQWKAELDEAKEQWLRLRAEFDNFRRRTQREQLETFERASMDMIVGLLPVVDNFEMALKIETADADYAKGIALIYQQLMDALKKAGLEPLEATGKPFDPNVHEALDMVPSEELEDHTVFDEFRKGYNFRGKLLRPAMVRVAVRPAER
jgi:molecular chaperone GrpE